MPYTVTLDDLRRDYDKIARDLVSEQFAVVFPTEELQCDREPEPDYFIELEEHYKVLYCGFTIFYAVRGEENNCVVLDTIRTRVLRAILEHSAEN